MPLVKNQNPLYASRTGIWEDELLVFHHYLMYLNPWKEQTYLSPVIVIVNPSYSFPWSLRLGTFVFTVNPSLVLLLNCFQKKKILEWTETDCLAIVLKHIKYMEQKWKRTDWRNRTKLLSTTLFHLSFISYWMEIINTERGILTFNFIQQI